RRDMGQGLSERVSTPVVMVKDQPAGNGVDTRALPLEHGLADLHVGRRFVDETAAQGVDDDGSGLVTLEKYHPRAFGSDHHRHPPGLVHEVYRGTVLHGYLDDLSGVTGVGERPRPISPLTKPLTHLAIVGKAASVDEYAVSAPDANFSALSLD